MIFWAFTTFWVHGIVYLLDEETKNIGYNILDLFSKCLWEYSSGHI